MLWFPYTTRIKTILTLYRLKWCFMEEGLSTGLRKPLILGWFKLSSDIFVVYLFSYLIGHIFLLSMP